MEFEKRNMGVNYEPTLAAAYKILKSEWDAGSRDREVGLHLMFTAWYGLIEPSHITGFTETADEQKELNAIMYGVHEYFKDKIADDAEALYAFGLMANMFWYMFDHDHYWEQVSINYQTRYRHLAPNGLDPSIFEDRGAYGEYYQGQVLASREHNSY